MPSPSPDTPIGDLVADHPARARIFEHLGLDYCCGGDRTLTEACEEHDLDPGTVVRMLDAAAEEPATHTGTDWTSEPLGTLIDHITSTHHKYLRRELPRLEQLVEKVTRVHGSEFSWLERLHDHFQGLKADLQSHMESEEESVFPAIRTLEAGRVLPDGSTLDAAALEQMETEHDEAGSILTHFRDLTNDYTPPEGACATFRAMIDGLQELEADMHQHVHKENNILFPRARSLAQKG